MENVGEAIRVHDAITAQLRRQRARQDAEWGEGVGEAGRVHDAVAARPRHRRGGQDAEREGDAGRVDTRAIQEQPKYKRRASRHWA